MISFKYEVFATAEKIRGKKNFIVITCYCVIIWNYANGSVPFLSLKSL